MFVEVDTLPKLALALRNDHYAKHIIERDNHVVDGKRPRLRAIKEIAYCYYMANRTVLSGFTDDVKSDRMRIKVGLPDTWKPDETVNNFIIRLREESVTINDQLLDSARELAKDFLNVINEMRKNSKRLIEFFSHDIDTLTDEELAKRTAEIKSAKEEITNYVKMFDNVYSVIRNIDELVDKRNAEERLKNKKTQLSSKETNFKQYEKKAVVDE